jgi:hypothetical protein
MARAGIAVGLAKGHVVTKKEKVVRPANRKGVSAARLLFSTEAWAAGAGRHHRHVMRQRGCTL